MSPAAKSVYYFGYYVILVGLTLIAVPNFLLETLQMPTTNEVWIRIVGVLAFCIGYYYVQSGRVNNNPFFWATVTMRIFVFIAFVLFALLKYVSPMLIVFGAIDLLGAIWTWSALRKTNVPVV